MKFIIKIDNGVVSMSQKQTSALTKNIKKERSVRKLGTVRSTNYQDALCKQSFIIHSCLSEKEMFEMIPFKLIQKLATRICMRPKQDSIDPSDQRKDHQNLIKFLTSKYRTLDSYAKLQEKRNLMKSQVPTHHAINSDLVFEETRFTNKFLTFDQKKQVINKLKSVIDKYDQKPEEFQFLPHLEDMTTSSSSAKISEEVFL